MLKNSIPEKTGIRAYALYSDAAIKQLGLEEICQTMTNHEETYEHLGTLTLWVQDMEPVWEAKKETFAMPFPPEDVLFELETNIDLPVEKVWDYLTRTEFRSILIGSDRQEIEKQVAGRTDMGSVYICYHGEDIRLQIVVLWKPFEQIVVEAPMPQNISLFWSFRLEHSGAGTRLVKAATRPRGGPALVRWLIGKMMPARRKEFNNNLLDFKAAVEEDSARQVSLPGSADLSTESIVQAVKEGLAAAKSRPPSNYS
jgi:uncharacterized protein YndB with AHSA1/START domain